MILKALREIWEVDSEIADAWALIAEQINAELEQLGVEEVLDLETTTLGGLLEQITVADLLNLYPRGFAVGGNGGLYEVVGTGDFDHSTRVGTLYVTPRAMPEEVPEPEPKRQRKSTYGV